MIGLAVVCGIGWGLTVGLSVAVLFLFRAYQDLRDERNRVGLRG